MSDTYDPREDYRPDGPREFFDYLTSRYGNAFDFALTHTNVPPALVGPNARKDREA